MRTHAFLWLWTVAAVILSRVLNRLAELDRR